MKSYPDFSSETKNNVLREVSVLAKCSGDYVVQYYDSWIENNNCLYIQIEFCSDNLKTIIEEKSKCFERQSSEAMDLIEFYISCQLFRELLECVQYIHGLNPPIIHRDLKTQNILINEKPRNHRFLKLCDFCLAQEYNSIPEIGSSDKNIPSTKADIYSLGKITELLFNLEIDS